MLKGGPPPGVAHEGGEFRVKLEKAAFRVGARRILAGTDWTIRSGENWLIWGPNGAGKTTLARAVTGEVAVVEGRRRFGPGKGRWDAARIAFEESAVMVARENERDLERDFAGRPDAQRTALAAVGGATAGEAMEALRRAGIAHLGDQPVRTLSSGEMRKLLVARALAGRPDLLVLDEPFDGLDPASRRRFAWLVEALMGDGLQVILITHRPSEILAGITHVMELAHGRVVYTGPVAGWRGLAEAPAPPVGNFPRPSASSDVLLRLEGVSVRYGGRSVLHDLDWEVRRGECWALSGPNGAGKTTLIRLVSGDHPQAYANRITLFGRMRGSGESVWDIKRRLGVVSPDLQIRYRRPWCGRDVVASGFFDSVGLFRSASPTQEAAVNRWMAELGIPHLAGERFDRMSSGEQRMILMARAMVKGPELLFLDEPCQSLDPGNRRKVLEAVDRMAGALDGLVFVTHHPDELPRCINRTLTLPGP